MYHHLLVPTDGSPPSSRCLTHAVALARALKARITVLHALEHRDALSGVFPYGLEAVAFDADLTARLETSQRQQGEQLLAAAIAEASAAGVSAQGESVRADGVWRAILEAAERHGCDLIMMASHGRSGLAALLMGSETLRVLTHSPLPVLIDRAELPSPAPTEPKPV